MELKDALGVKRAAVRKLEQELGIHPSQVPIEKFDFVTKMRYQARQDEYWIEREIDHCLVIHADVDVNPNPNVKLNGFHKVTWKKCWLLMT